MGTAQLIVAALGLLGTRAAADNGLNDSLLWGPYKSNLYLGIRPKLPHGLWAGLMWAKTDTYADVQNLLRYTCEQSDDLHGYGWDEYDARRGGVQTIHDGGNMIDMTTSFVKIPGGSHGGSWAARIKGMLREGAPADTKTMIFYYLAQEGLGELAVEGGGGDEYGFAGDVTFRGSSAALGEYSLVIGEGSGRHPSSSHAASSRRRGDRTVVRSINLPPQQQWQAVQAVFNELRGSLRWVQDNFENDNLPPPWQTFQLEPQAGSGNVQVVQKVFEGDFEFDVLFSSGSAGTTLTSADVTQELEAASSAFARRFESVFELKPPYTAAKYQRFARSLFSSLLGGVGYFSGEQVVDRSYADEYEEEEEGFWEGTAAARARGGQKLEGPYELLTAVPSRSFFPRGFLWDEGFHLALVAEWDADLAEEVVRSWYGTMDDDGWIAREQILGDEARAKVPPEFQVQYPHYANPPTLFLTVEQLMNRGSGEGEGEGRFLEEMYPLLRRQYEWFRRTQRGEVRAYDRTAYSSREAYRWKGRTETHCLTSGLDDYPRPQPPSPAELHVDLLAWVGVMARSLGRMATTLGHVEDAEEYAQQSHAIERNLVDLHWSDSEGCFCDATVDEAEEHRLVCHRGYVSIFPFLVGLMRADDERVGRILDLVGDEGELFSPHGLRSLSRRDEQYGTGENYWRGPVWMPLNYLALVELHKLATQKGPFRERARGIYGRLRRNLVDTVFASWEETGIAWEQYDAETGKGQRNRQFTGWTSLVVKMMAMEDVEDVEDVEGHVRDEL